MKFAITVFFILATLNLKAQNIVVLKHKFYTSYYDTVLRYPTKVIWTIKKSTNLKRQRKNEFQKDYLLPNKTDNGKYYIDSGYDRGHMVPYADVESYSDDIITDCFLYSNIAPQTPKLNRGPWKQLESYVRNLLKLKYIDSINVECGCFGNSNKKIGKISIPDSCYKIIKYKHCNDCDITTEEYRFPNSNKIKYNSFSKFKVK